MNRLFFGMASVLVWMCLCFVSVSAAEEVEADGTDDVVETADLAPTAVADHNYIKAVYATTAPASGESYNPEAVRVFSTGDTVYLITRYHMATAGDITLYRILSDASGAIKGMYTHSWTPSTGAKWSSRRVTGLPAGVYYFTTVILSPGNHMISPDGYMFVVE